MTEYRVYVIELDKGVSRKSKFRKANPDYQGVKPCVYVGHTAKTPEERFAQHSAGKRSSSFVKQHGIRLKPKLYERYQPSATRKEAEAKEQWLAEKIRSRGYGVWWN
ncbi:MAG: ribose-5-phosphate isomerase [Deltaproteobacteria bacterium]|nr:MAG: ribose-5-phosphate isomerase [Deltaproteobacteria bacterium]